MIRHRTHNGYLAQGVVAIVLTVASPAWGIPFWDIPDGGSSGAVGGDGQYSPFDGRYVLRSGQARFLDMHGKGVVLSPGQSQTVTGTLTISMDLEGKAYNAAQARNPVADGTSLGHFELVFTYYNAILKTRYNQGTDETMASIKVAARGKDASYGFGTLTYVKDTLPDLPKGDHTEDGEAQGDVIVLRTPSCDVAGGPCPGFFFSWSGRLTDPNTSTTGRGASPVGKADEKKPRGFFELPMGDRIPRGSISLIHGGDPCPKDKNPGPGSQLVSCNPVRANFDSDRAYATFVRDRAAAFGFTAIMQNPGTEAFEVKSANRK